MVHLDRHQLAGAAITRTEDRAVAAAADEAERVIELSGVEGACSTPVGWTRVPAGQLAGSQLAGLGLRWRGWLGQWFRRGRRRRCVGSLRRSWHRDRRWLRRQLQRRNTGSSSSRLRRQQQRRNSRLRRQRGGAPVNRLARTGAQGQRRRRALGKPTGAPLHRLIRTKADRAGNGRQRCSWRCARRWRSSLIRRGSLSRHGNLGRRDSLSHSGSHLICHGGIVRHLCSLSP